MDRIPQAWPGWKAEELIGEGAFGRVYKASRTAGGVTTRAAVKVINIPRDEAEAASLRSMGYDAEAIRAYFEDEARDLLDEIALMDALQGAPHVVHVEDYALLERGDGVGWAVLIRMELLEPLAGVAAREGLPSLRLAARIAADVADALSRCHELGVLHRDVKPGNVFRSPFGEYKLGDFGIARRSGDASRSTKTVAGTEDYMAPEVLGGGGEPPEGADNVFYSRYDH